MASAVMIVGGAVVNALAFSGSNYLFSKLNNNDEEKNDTMKQLKNWQRQEMNMKKKD